MRRISVILFLAVITLYAHDVIAQEQKIGFFESDYILAQIPEYEGIQQRLDLLSSTWDEELKALEEEIEQLEEEFKAKEILYTEEIRKQKRQEIEQKKREKEAYLARKFGPNGEYFTKQGELLEPIQRQVFTAVRAVASRQGFDFVFDRSSDIKMVYAREEWNLNEAILTELGIETEQQ
ncbi:MAG: OmpH family outer membrane protein [Balneolaceae bacterium]|nr:OmpH family outer membrane protein [Balneolaceae bacterium]